MTRLTVIATLRAQAGHEAALGEQLQGLVAPTRREPGCLDYDLHRSNDDPAEYVFYENWISKDDLDKHLQMPHMRAFAELAPGLLDGPVQTRLLTMFGEPAR